MKVAKGGKSANWQKSTYLKETVMTVRSLRLNPSIEAQRRSRKRPMPQAKSRAVEGPSQKRAKVSKGKAAAEVRVLRRVVLTESSDNASDGSDDDSDEDGRTIAETLRRSVLEVGPAGPSTGLGGEPVVDSEAEESEEEVGLRRSRRSHAARVSTESEIVPEPVEELDATEIGGVGQSGPLMAIVPFVTDLTGETVADEPSVVEVEVGGLLSLVGDEVSMGVEAVHLQESIPEDPIMDAHEEVMRQGLRTVQERLFGPSSSNDEDEEHEINPGLILALGGLNAGDGEEVAAGDVERETGDVAVEVGAEVQPEPVVEGRDDSAAVVEDFALLWADCEVLGLDAAQQAVLRRYANQDAEPFLCLRAMGSEVIRRTLLGAFVGQFEKLVGMSLADVSVNALNGVLAALKDLHGVVKSSNLQAQVLRLISVRVDRRSREVTQLKSAEQEARAVVCEEEKLIAELANRIQQLKDEQASRESRLEGARKAVVDLQDRQNVLRDAMLAEHGAEIVEGPFSTIGEFLGC